MTNYNEDLQQQLSTTEEELGNSVTQMSVMEGEMVLLQSQVVNLKNKLMESDMMRRKLHNQVQELKVRRRRSSFIVVVIVIKLSLLLYFVVVYPNRVI